MKEARASDAPVTVPSEIVTEGGLLDLILKESDYARRAELVQALARNVVDLLGFASKYAVLLRDELPLSTLAVPSEEPWDELFMFARRFERSAEHLDLSCKQLVAAVGYHIEVSSSKEED